MLKAGCRKPGSVPPSELLKGVLALESKKIKPEGDQWKKALMSTSNWRLTYQCPEDGVTKASKGQKGFAGYFFPLVAAQRFLPQSGPLLTFENGVFLGPVFSLTFAGDFQMEGKLARFTVEIMRLGVGPWSKKIQLGKQTPLADMTPSDAKKLPFFIYAYADNEIVVARGRSGGVAIWIPGDSDWAAKAGVLQVYGSKQR